MFSPNHYYTVLISQHRANLVQLREAIKYDLQLGITNQDSFDEVDANLENAIADCDCMLQGLKENPLFTSVSPDTN